MAIEIGNILEGTVTGITNFGAFVELPGGATGLVHISEVADAYVKDVRDYLKDNDKVKVKVIAIENGKIGLSIKQANPNPNPAPRPSFRPNAGPRNNPNFRREEKPSFSFEDRLAKFIKESDERQQEVRRSVDSKRGGRGGKKKF